MTDTGWTIDGFRVIESENAPDPNGIKHLGTSPFDYSPFLSRIVNPCDLHGAILDVTDPVQNMRAAYDYHTRRSVYNSKERTMTTGHIDQLAQWYADAEQVTKTNLPNVGDVLIFPNSNSGGYTIEPNTGEWAPNIVGHHETVRILARAPKPKPAWHDADFIVARYEYDDHWQGYLRHGGDLWIDSEGRKYTTGVLRDVTPLIEAKVTDEMIDRILDVIAARFDNYPAGIGEELALAALGLGHE